MYEYGLCDSQYKFMCVVWKNAPINYGELVKLCNKEPGRKKSTAYTVIKNCTRGAL